MNTIRAWHNQEEIIDFTDADLTRVNFGLSITTDVDENGDRWMVVVAKYG